MKKKVFAVFMIVAMLLCFMPSMAFADGSAEADNGAVLDKQAVQNNDGSVEITLKAHTGSKTVTSVSSKPVDIVLVLDQSGSMAYSFGTVTRQAAMKDAVANFIDNIDPNGEHRVSVVTFGSDASTLAGWTDANETGKSSLIGEINNLPVSPEGATNVAAGMDTAASLLKSANADSQKVVIVFTDGVPTKTRYFDTDVADRAISIAKGIKDAGAKVYTIGIFGGADPTQLYGEKADYGIYKDVICSGEVNSVWGGNFLSDLFGGDVRNDDIPAGNRFLNYLSNNFLAAYCIGIKYGNYDPGNYFMGNIEGYKITQNFERSDSKYYLTASDASGLSDVFKQIQSDTMVPAIELDASTVIRDGISAYFNAPAATDVKVYTAAYNGTSFDETSLADITSDVTIDVSSEKVVTVTGFNFNDNYTSPEPRPVNGKEFYGKELIIKFTVTPNYEAIDSALNAGSLTRNADGADYKVPTNTDAQILKGTEVVASADGGYASMHTVTYQIAGETEPYKVQLRAAGAKVQKEADLAAHTAWTSKQIAATNISTSGYFTMPAQDVVFNCDAEYVPVVPDQPNATDIDGLTDKVQVECETNTAEHAEALYDLTDFSISEVQGTEGNYYVTLTVPAAPYVAKYVIENGNHTQVATDPVSKELRATYDGEKWYVAETDKVVFHVECEEAPAPVVPDQPNATDIDGLTDKVQVECETNTAEHAEALYDLTDFSISEVQGTEGNYYVTLTVPAAPYVAKYVIENGNHTQVATDPVSKELRATYDGEKWSVAETDKVVFHVECEETPAPVEPETADYIVEHYLKGDNGEYTLKDIERLTGKIGAVVTAEAKTYEGYYCNKAAVGTIEKGIVIAQGPNDDQIQILTLKLYYDKNVDPWYPIIPTPTPDPEGPGEVIVPDPDVPLGPGEVEEPEEPEDPIVIVEEPEVPRDDAPETDVPKTGDNGFGTAGILFFLSAAGLAALAVTGRKKEEAEK